MWGLLFDLDGTLALTNPLHEVAWREVLAEQGVHLTAHGYLTEVSGRSNPDIVRRLLPKLSPEQARGVFERKEQRFRQAATTLAAPAGLLELVLWAEQAQGRLGVVTNAPRANALHVLAQLGLEARFKVVVAAEDVQRAKPDPEPFRVGAQRLGLTTAECYAFEDSPSGIKAAVAAHLQVAGLTTGHTAEELSAAGATVLAADFSDPGLLQALSAFVALLRR